jgi:hypothetical protein
MSPEPPDLGSEPAVATFLRRWAAMLSLPSVEVLARGDHLVVREAGELVAAGSLLALPAPPPEAG